MAGRGKSWRGRDLLFIIRNARWEGFGAGHHCLPSEDRGKQVGSGRQWTEEVQRGAGHVGRAGLHWDVLEVELAGLKDEVRKGLPYPS